MAVRHISMRSAPRGAFRAVASLVLVHSTYTVSRHMLLALRALWKLRKMAWWAVPVQIWHLYCCMLRILWRRVIGTPRSRRWGCLVELFVDGIRPHPLFIQNWDAVITPFMEAVTLMDYYAAAFARLCHPRVKFETVTQGCPRPMTWVWFEDTVEGNTAPEVVILFLHGGGYWAFTGKSHLEYVTRIIKAYRGIPLRVKACVVDLRRAPEHPWPAPLEDAMACYEFLQKGAGYNASQIIIAGDSAGGGLCLCTLLAIRDSEQKLPLCATVISPITDMSRCAEQYPDQDRRTTPFTDFLPPEAATASAALYIVGECPKNPLISPKYGQLHALPPILIQTGESELFARDSVEYAQRLEIYNGTVQLEMYPEMPHVFPMFAPLGLQDGHTAVRRQAKFVKRVLNGGLTGSRRLQIQPDEPKRNSSHENVREVARPRRLSSNASSPALSVVPCMTRKSPSFLIDSERS